ncbi:IL16 isoform 10, partial [Pongo abelii]
SASAGCPGPGIGPQTKSSTEGEPGRRRASPAWKLEFRKKSHCMM